MIVCHCMRVCDGPIRRCSTLKEVREKTSATLGCNCCLDAVIELIGTDVIPEKFKEYDVVELENWRTASSSDDPYRPPELNSVCLKGIVKGHRRKEDGTEVFTSSIRDSQGKYVLTSNTLYKLGSPKEEFLEYLKSIGKEFDPLNPVKMK